MITSLLVQASSNITFDSLEFDRTTAVDQYAYKVTAAQNISFNNLDVHGSLDSNPKNDLDGIIVRDSTNVSISNTEFHELSHAIQHLNNNGLSITDSNFHDLRSDGVLGYGSSNVLIARNSFSDFYPNDADHPDAIQFWSADGAAAVHNLTIIDNVVRKGAGGDIQGIFLRDSDALMFAEVTIRGNDIQGGMGNGIYVEGGMNLIVDDNIVRSTSTSTSWIRIEDSNTVSLTDNIASKFIYANLTDLFSSGNVFGGSTTSDGGTSTSGSTSSSTTVAATIAGTASSEVLNGTDVANKITGEGGSDVLNGAGGSDTLDGGAGADSLNGGAGDDVLDGGIGNDRLDGGDGLDTVSFANASESVVVDLGRTSGQYTGVMGTDTIVNVENVTGGAYRDTLKGSVIGNVLKGGSGNDNLTGGGGGDSLYGGTGADSFVYTAISDSAAGVTGRDKIYDFNSAEGDKINLRGIDARVGYLADDAFTMVTGFSRVSGQLTVTYETDHYVVRGDVNGDAVADFAIDVYSATKPGSGDFLL